MPLQCNPVKAVNAGSGYVKSKVGTFFSSVLLSADLLVNILPSPGIYDCCFSEEKKGIKKKRKKRKKG